MLELALSFAAGGPAILIAIAAGLALMALTGREQA